MSATIVWAYRPLPELDGRTGLVECEEELALRLIAQDLVQDPRVGALHLRDLDDFEPTRYRTREMRARRSKGEG